MFYHPSERDHGLPHDPLKAIVAPRPIGWISSQDSEGRLNLAPYSFFNLVADRPPIVMFSSYGRKDSVRNVEETGEFVCNLTTYDLREAVNATSAGLAHGESEFDAAGLATEASALVKPPRIAGVAAALECRYLKSDVLVGLDGQRSSNIIVYGEIVGCFIRDDLIVDGRFDMTAARTIARCGYMDYATVESLFVMHRPAGGGG
ncbi:NADH-FMN oxidoreductase RutF, flavin reductase (DIM6/NTAB) family [Faunimonas pinastri]|uniref:NADH-FMN oxidoreductase RutF, flavin reductase (DIM6/NTAB) family n=1 Tax=Faunimonas pinastri TaxID=1855383 RepID=A0A1H9DA43_9HYPH|nr:flavin reductase family protein [Faunimonas pinastri]SEQ10177.1 NADH-FMN oxidoreductase RutF, flavin reductase (DIM6/NTAB) family [Faunimonas pinastri]